MPYQKRQNRDKENLISLAIGLKTSRNTGLKLNSVSIVKKALLRRILLNVRAISAKNIYQKLLIAR